MAISGHKTLSQVQVYIEEVEQERLAEPALRQCVNLNPASSTNPKARAALPVQKQLLQPLRTA